jgi:hypothetical protein
MLKASMGNPTLTGQRVPLAQQGLRMIAFVILASSIAVWWRYHSANTSVTEDLTLSSDLEANSKQARPLVHALDRFRTDNGLYPTTLNQLAPAYLPSLEPFSAFRYSARQSDWVYLSDGCITREKTLKGWVLEEAKAYQTEVARFKHDCITGYRDYQLQSPDFAPDARSRYLERWAYYDSELQHWVLGWCEHIPAAKGTGSELATNGICRGRPRGAADSRQDSRQ